MWPLLLLLMLLGLVSSHRCRVACLHSACIRLHVLLGCPSLRGCRRAEKEGKKAELKEVEAELQQFEKVGGGLEWKQREGMFRVASRTACMWLLSRSLLLGRASCVSPAVLTTCLLRFSATPRRSGRRSSSGAPPR